ncbi:MAG: alpha/beta hydrolase [Candidatus Krumholzibacteria bacterium]|nr:alpha/beta hydrolase [Candidatus Krumholzibacteria bacterium]
MKMILLWLAIGCGSAPAVLEVAPSEELTVCSEGPQDGEPVVLIPGLSGCSYGFRKLTPLLHEQGLRTIIIEPLAVGESARPLHVDYTMTAQAARLGTVLDSLEIEDAVFVAQGISGAIVFRLAVERPELLSGIVSVEGGSAEEAISPNIRNTLKVAKVLAKMGGKGLLRDRYAENLKKSSGDPSWVDRRTVGRYFRGTGRDISAALGVMVAMTEQAEPWAMTPRLPEIRIPVIVLLGSAPHEAELNSEDIEILRQGLVNVEFRDVPGAGHFIYEEQPQAVAEAVVDMVTNLSVGGFSSVGATLVPGDDGGTDSVQPRNSR